MALTRGGGAGDLPWDGPVAYLQWVVDTLLDNAVRHGFKGRESGQITVTLGRSDTGLSVRVADDGQGVDPKLLPRVFEPMANAGKGGQGLDLSAAHFIVVRLLGGSIGCESPAGQGAAFTVSLPAVSD